MRKNVQIVEDKAKESALEQLEKQLRHLLRLLEEARLEPSKTLHQLEDDRKKSAVSIVDETFGAIKGLDALTLIHLAEDEEFSGY